mgnify:FL=1
MVIREMQDVVQYPQYPFSSMSRTKAIITRHAKILIGFRFKLQIFIARFAFFRHYLTSCILKPDLIKVINIIVRTDRVNL